jgi:hypothetical protein
MPEDITVAPYVLRPAADSATIRWGSADSAPRLEVWPEEGVGKCREVRGVTRGEGLFEAVLGELSPGTRYCYRRQGHDESRSFRTAPANRDAAYSVVIFGDPQNHLHYPEAVAAMAALQPDLAIGLGDYVGASDGASYRRFLRLSEPLLATTALLPVPGNHDYRRHCSPFPEDNDSEVFDRYLGDGDGNQVSLPWGPLRLLGLNYPDRGTWTPDCPRALWLREQLNEARSADQRVVLFHHCPCFTSTRITWAVDDRVLPALLADFADVVLADFGGHVHTYERSEYRGIPYITTGGAGELYDFPVDECPNPYQIVAAGRLHVCRLQVRAEGITVSAVALDGQVFDEFGW